MKTNNFDGYAGNANDRFSYAHAGVEIALGKKNSPQLQNYSALAALREQNAMESEELRRALSTQEENARRDRETYAQEMGDDDSDGVANKFDKCRQHAIRNRSRWLRMSAESGCSRYQGKSNRYGRGS